MQLTLYSDYSLRVLLYLSHMPKKTATIEEIAHFYKISKNHLVKVVHHLAHSGYITTSQGRGGGLRITETSLNHTLAEILKKTESNFYLVECFNQANDHCMISLHCSLKKILHQAFKAFFQVLEHYTLAHLNQPQLTQQISHFLNSKKI